MARNYNAGLGLAGSVPFAGAALELQSSLMKDAILGPRPESVEPGHVPIESSLEMKSALASVFMEHDIGDPGDLEILRAYDLNGDGQIDVPSKDLYDGFRFDYQRILDDYYNGLDPVISNPVIDNYDKAYRDVLR